jgi:hypothetical protein
MPTRDYGWTISSQRGGPGGAQFDDVHHLEATGRPADEFRLEEVEFFWWAAIGGMRATYRNVVDGSTVQCPQRGRIGAGSAQTSWTLALKNNEWVTGAFARVGDSKYRAGGSCVDRLKLLTQRGGARGGGDQDFDVQGTSAAGPCQTCVFQGSLQVTVPSEAPQRSGAPSAPTVRTVAPLERMRSSRSCRGGDEPSPQGLITGGQVVRAIAGRAGDSLDAISFVLGPPIPEEWTPRTHHLFPQRMRSAVRTLLLASQRSGDDCLWGKLDRDTLFQIIATTCRVCP